VRSRPVPLPRSRISRSPAQPANLPGDAWTRRPAHLTVAESLDRSNPDRPSAPPRSGDRGTETFARAEARPPRVGSRAGPSSLAAPITAQSDEDIALDSDPARGGAHESRHRRSMVAGNQDSQRHLQRAPILRGRSDVRTSKWPAWLSSPSHRRSSPSRLPSGAAESDSPRRATWLGRGAGYIAGAGEPRRRSHLDG